MIYREKFEVDQFEEHYRNIVLRQQSVFGPWFVMGLGAMLTLFVMYLVYSNLLFPSATPSSPERSLRVITISSGPPPSVSHTFDEAFAPQLGSAITIVPHSRATHALLGGHGPAAVSGHTTAMQRGTPELFTGREILPR